FYFDLFCKYVKNLLSYYNCHFYADNSNLLKLPEFFRITMPNILYETLALGDALKLPPRYFPLATTSIVILGCFHAHHL
ncbi:MAG: hypothetical protein WBZ20_15245, partial [Nitrososphaeraceae archaeon]